MKHENFHVSKNKTSVERVYQIISQSSSPISRESLLALNRDNWGIANRLDQVRDIAFREDRCGARKGDTPYAPKFLHSFANGILPSGSWLVSV
jgi:hypothetical protein